MPAFSVSKSITIEAPAEKVFAEVRDFTRWKLWSPWIIVEPDCDLEYADDGNSYSWEGEVLGSGKMEVAGEAAPHRIEHKLTFLKSWKSEADVAFTFEENGDETRVTWRMDSSLPFFMFMFKKMMIAMIGMDYRRGLGMLKDLVESGSVPSSLAFREETREKLSYVGVECEADIDRIQEAMQEGMGRLRVWLDQSKAESSGPPLTIYQKWDMIRGTTRFTLGAPVINPPEGLPAGFVSSRMPSMHVFAIEHTGPYRHLGNAWAAGMMRGRAKVFRQNRNLQPFEIYVSDPDEEPENKLVTVVYFPKAP